MSIVKIKRRENPFVQIDKRPLQDANLSWKAKGLLAYCLSKPDNWEIRIDNLIKSSTDGREAVQTGLKELRKNGYARIEPTKDPDTGQMTGRAWIIYEEKQEIHAENPEGDSATDKRDSRRSEKPSDGKSAPNKKEKNEKNKEIEEEAIPPSQAASSNPSFSSSPDTKESERQALIKYLNTGIKNNALYAMCEGIDLTLPEIREKFAKYWLGLERTFTGSAADKRYVLNSLTKWAESEVVNCRNKANEKAPERFDNKLEKIIEIHHFYSHRIASEEKKKAAQDIAKKLFKDGVTLEQIEFQMSKVPHMTSDWRHVDYFLSKFEKALTIEPEDWKTEYRIGVGNQKPITRYQLQHGTA